MYTTLDLSAFLHLRSTKKLFIISVYLVHKVISRSKLKHKCWYWSKKIKIKDVAFTLRILLFPFFLYAGVQVIVSEWSQKFRSNVKSFCTLREDSARSRVASSQRPISDVDKGPQEPVQVANEAWTAILWRVSQRTQAVRSLLRRQKNNNPLSPDLKNTQIF